MKEIMPKIKINFINGLKKIVLDELSKNNLFALDNCDDESIYLEYSDESLSLVKNLKSIKKAFVVLVDKNITPVYLYKHKSILKNLIEDVLVKNNENFNTFKIICAGKNSKEIESLKKYVQEEFSLNETEDSDLKIHIIKLNDTWELGVEITKRPLSQRFYKVKNMPGSMDSTIAFSVNHLADLSSASSYLNIFSGSATLLIEAALSYSNLERLIGFDNGKENISLAIQNIREAKLLKRIQLKELDIFDNPELGKFDVITSNLPFGMLISKNEELDKLYEQFIKYCESSLNINGTLVIYTSKTKLFEQQIKKSKFNVVETYSLKIMTNSSTYLRPKIFVCKR